MSTNVDWIPNDPDAALPLSADYRKSLRSLCTLITNGSKLPADIMDKKEVLSKMCKKLAADDAIGGGSLDANDFYSNNFLQNILNSLGLPKVQTKWIVAFVVCSLAGAYQYTRPRKGMKLGSDINRIRTSRNELNVENDDNNDEHIDAIKTTPILSSSNTPASIREARLRHFEQMLKDKEEQEQLSLIHI